MHYQTERHISVDGVGYGWPHKFLHNRKRCGWNTERKYTEVELVSVD